MKNQTIKYNSVITFLLLALGAAVLATAVGCARTPLPGETSYKKSVAWPIFDVEKIEGVDKNGTKWIKEKGDACCFLATWSKQYKYDKDHFLIYSKTHSAFFPFYSDDKEETPTFKEHNASVLFFPYQSRQLKTDQDNK